MSNTVVEHQPRLKEGMLARIIFRGAPREVLLIDKDSIDRSSGESIVFVVDEDSRARAVTVQTGTSQGQFIEVVGDVQPGERLVTEGVERLRPFQQVTVLEGKISNGAVADAAELTEQSVGDETVASHQPGPDDATTPAATSGG